MRRSTKCALFSAFAITLALAQTDPYEIQGLGLSKVERHRAGRAKALFVKLNAVREDKINMVSTLRWLVAWVSSPDTQKVYAKSSNVLVDTEG